MTTEAQLELPRGIRIFTESHRPRPFACQWRADGKRKTKFFLTEKLRDTFAESLAKGVEHIGIAAYQLNPSEAHEWRAFRAQLGDEVSLDAVLKCWLKHGDRRDVPTVREAVEAYTAAKKAEGIADTTLSHYKSAYTRLTEKFGGLRVDSMKREDLADWLAGLNMKPYSVRTHLIRARGLFNWLKVNRTISESPCDGLKAPRIVQEEVRVLTVDEARTLFSHLTRRKDLPRELLGRLALEAFAGLRFSSAAAVLPGDIAFDAKGITLPAAKIKTRRRQYIDGLPKNLWKWLAWSTPDGWGMTHKQYMFAKSRAFDLAEVPHPHNCLRHSFATYHVAANKDVSKTAVILCHSSPKMLWSHYKGKATQADGRAYFEILPP